MKYPKQATEPDRRVLQATGTHPAPCARHCEAKAYEIEIRMLRNAQRKPLTHEQRFDLLTEFEAYKHEWHAHAILIDMVEAAHNIKENT